mgnify:CR=1 FL=1
MRQINVSYRIIFIKISKLNCKIPDHIKVDVEKRIDSLEVEIEQLKENIQHKENNISNEEKYRCRYCCKEFSEQRNLTEHLQKKRCRGKNDNVEIYERELGITKPECNPLTCRFCNMVFTKQSSYSRHMNSNCKGKMQYEHDLEKRVLENRKNLAAVASISINGNHNNNTTNNTVNNNIYLPPMNAFGSENLDYITTKMLLKQIELCKDFTDITDTVKNFTQLIHAHPAHPENHNVLLKGSNTAFAEVFNGENFEQSNALQVEDKILEKVGKLILEKKEEYCDEQTKKEKNIPKQLENNLIKLEEAVDDNIQNELFRDSVSEASRNLTTYRNTVKGALISKKDDIQSTQNLLS